MPISELGYRHWEGKRIHPWLRWLAIARSDIGIAYRSNKTLRRFLILAWMPILYFGPVFFAVGWVADPANDLSEGGLFAEIAVEIIPPGVIDELRANPEVLLPAVWAPAFFFFFSLTQFLSLVVLALVAPPLISKDVRSKAFLLYFSKPISSWEYLLGKLSVALFFIFVITLFPALLLYAISIAFSPDLGTLVATAPILARIFAAALVVGVPASMVALLLSSLTRDYRIATFAWMALWIVGWVAHATITFEMETHEAFQAPQWALILSLREVATNASAAVFDLSGHLQQLFQHLRAAGVDPSVLFEEMDRDSGPLQRALTDAMDPSLDTSSSPTTVAVVFSVILTVFCLALLRRRVTKPVRI